MKICIISDTHGLHDQVVITPCDVLIHCGDCTNDAGRASLRNFLHWFDKQPATHKIFIAGNHDWAFEKWPDLALLMVVEEAPSVIYLQDSQIVIDGIKFHGSPYTPRFFDWAFNKDRGAAIKRHWDLIPKDTDVLISHGPPKGFLDYNKYDKFHCGCEDLLNAVMEIRPAVHAFGHIHSGYGTAQIDGTILMNASVCNERYQPVNAPLIHEL